MICYLVSISFTSFFRRQVNLPQSAIRPGQQATSNAMREMPSVRATGMATPISSAPSNSRPTSAVAMMFYLRVAFRAVCFQRLNASNPTL